MSKEILHCSIATYPGQGVKGCGWTGRLLVPFAPGAFLVMRRRAFGGDLRPIHGTGGGKRRNMPEAGKPGSLPALPSLEMREMGIFLGHVCGERSEFGGRILAWAGPGSSAFANPGHPAFQ